MDAKIKAQQEAMRQADLSPCVKRKVGAVIVDKEYNIISSGYNSLKDHTKPCENELGETLPDVVHAEIMALRHLNEANIPMKMFVTHEPCSSCKEALANFEMPYEVVNIFMKHDTGKLRYSLVPPEAIESIAEVMTFGAKKYKPNNWKHIEDTDRYMDALYRHLEAHRRGIKRDEETGFLHLSHAITNLAFLLHFEKRKDS